MTRTIQILRGTEAQNDAFTGAVGELTMDTTNNEIRIHDGSTVGGHKIGGTIQNQNTAAGATNPIYDWVGAKTEYEAQNVATLHPDWVCYVTDDIGLPATEVGRITEDINDLKEHTVVEFQEPTAANNYTWYRLYADGWVEQGGFLPKISGDQNQSITLPIAMANSNYTVVTNMTDETYSGAVPFNLYTTKTQTTTGFFLYSSGGWARYWLVCGMAA